MALILLIAFGALAAQVIRLYLFPFRNCQRCGGTGRKNSRRAFGLCPHCGGTGRVLRPGARTVHRAVLSARSPQARDRLRHRVTAAADRTQAPGHPAPRQLPPPERRNP